MRERLKHLLQNYTNTTKIMSVVKKDKDLYAWVMDQTKSYPEDCKFTERLYSCAYDTNLYCPEGNRKKFKTIISGYSYCGRAEDCFCLRKESGKGAKEKYASMSDKELQEVRKKREQTNVQKYGVTNAGQTKQALETRKKLYSDKDKVSEITEKVRTTKKEKYGNEKYNNFEKARETNKKKYGTEYFTCTEEYKKARQKSTVERNPSKAILYDPEQLSKLVTEKSLGEVSEIVGYESVSPLVQKLKMYGIDDYKKQSKGPYSDMEEQVAKFVESITDCEVVRSRRDILNGKELDIHIPDKNIAIEFNGLYWHNEIYKDKEYHLNKFKECLDKGIQLIQITENDWIHNNELTKKRLVSIIAADKLPTIYARKTKIVVLDTKKAKEFIEQNHFQGYAPSSIKLGLVDNKDDLLSVMTFSKPRKGIGNNNFDGTYELIRFCSKDNIQVVGGASKLLKYFITNYKPKEVVSYSLNDWSDGKLYKRLGFNKEKVSLSYYYADISGQRLIHRLNMTKHNLVKKGFPKHLSEKQITMSLGLPRYWTSGTTLWKMEINNES